MTVPLRVGPLSNTGRRLRSATTWDRGREDFLEPIQGGAYQYLLAYYIWQFVNGFVPSPSRYREMALDQGVTEGKIAKASGSFTTPEREQAAYLAENDTYQTWRLMANMKELLAEEVSQILCLRYGPLTAKTCESILASFEAKDFIITGDVKTIALKASSAKDSENSQVFSRIMSMFRFVSEQFWENRKQQLLSTSRLRTYLLKRDVAATYKSLLFEFNERRNLDKAWKPQGKTFVESLPDTNA